MKIKSGSIFRTVATTSSVAVLAVSLAFSGSSVSAKSSDEFVPHKLVLGPIRLDMAKADNSGTINKDPLYIADRQAMMSMKIIPGVGADYAKPVVAQLIGVPWMITGNFHAAKNVTVSMDSSKDDPFEKLPVLRVVGGTYVSGDMTLSFSEMKVLADWLK